MIRNATDSPLVKIASYTEILAKDPRSTVFVPLAETYRQIGMLAEGLEVAMKGVRALPGFSPGFTVLGRIQAQKGDLGGAALSLEKALAIDPANVVALKSLARIRQQQGDIQRALNLLHRVESVKPDDESIQKLKSKLIQTLTEKKKLSDAGSLPGEEEPAGGRGKTDPLSTLTIAELYIRQGFPQRALKVYRDLLRIDPKNQDVRSRLIALKAKMDGGEEPSESPGKSPAGKVAEQPKEAPVTAGEGTAEAVAPVTSRSPLEIFNRWLDVIQNRRMHV